ncbi:MAG TPA: hypothetical protein VND93_22225, partial [Myxococcales bacterium]|nr:hypothetical protein [Myxococcales bacterium]
MIRSAPALLLLLPGLALAGAGITVDGQNGDWAATRTCFPQVTGDGLQQVELDKVCLENDGSSSNAGSLFLLMESPTTWPSDLEIRYGFGLDQDKNGKLDQTDAFWTVAFPESGTHQPPSADPVRLEHWVQNRIAGSYLPGEGCGGPAGSDTWSAKRSGQVVELAISSGCLGLSYGMDGVAFQAGVFPGFDSTAFMYYDATTSSIVPAAPPPDVITLTARAIPGVAQLKWTNPAQHDGVLILRAVGAPPNTRPVDHVPYLSEQFLGNAKVVFSQNFGSTSTFTDSTLTNGTRYYYRVYNHYQNLTYALGDTPPGGIWAEPKARTGANPLWCYSTGFPNTLQPVTDLGVAVYSAGNLGAITANVTDTATVSNDGVEKFRPVSVGAPVQSRFLLSALAGRTGQYAVVGDQNGKVTAVNAATGAVLWVANGGAALGERIQGQPIAQLASRANAAYLAVHSGRDLIFVGTRNTTLPNKVYALSSVDGQVVWTYAPGDLGMINGGFMVDYEYNRLFVAARGTGSLRVLSSVTGQEVAAPLTSRFNLGDIDTGVVRDQGFTGPTTDDSAVVATTTGIVYAIDIVNLVIRWSVTPGASSTFVTPTGGGFIISLNSGAVQRWYMNTTLGKPTL